MVWDQVLFGTYLGNDQYRVAVAICTYQNLALVPGTDLPVRVVVPGTERYLTVEPGTGRLVSGTY